MNYAALRIRPRINPLLPVLWLVVMCSCLCAQPVKPEFRGVWVQTWRPGILNPTEVDATVQWAVESNVNALIVQVRRVGDAYYNSSYEPRASNITGGPDFDPLGYTIEKAHAEGVAVYAWVNVFRVKTAGTRLEPDHVAASHPDWLSKDKSGSTTSADGSFLDPGVPAVRDYLVEITSDILAKYDVDGIVLDYVRYPGKNWGYNDRALRLFNEQYGRMGVPSPDDPEWCDWRREQVTETVRAIYETVRMQKPRVVVCAATVAWGPCPTDFTRTDAYGHLLQDWRAWMEQGILDANMPMNYKDPSVPRQVTNYRGWNEGARRWSYGRLVISGIMLYGRNISGAVSQIQLARSGQTDGIAGFLFSQVDCSQTVAGKLRSSVFAAPAPLPAMPWKEESGQMAETSTGEPEEATAPEVVY